MNVNKICKIYAKCWDPFYDGNEPVLMACVKERCLIVMMMICKRSEQCLNCANGILSLGFHQLFNMEQLMCVLYFTRSLRQLPSIRLVVNNCHCLKSFCVYVFVRLSFRLHTQIFQICVSLIGVYYIFHSTCTSQCHCL